MSIYKLRSGWLRASFRPHPFGAFDGKSRNRHKRNASKMARRKVRHGVKQQERKEWMSELDGDYEDLSTAPNP